MFRTTDIVLIVVMLAAAGVTYKTKHDAENRLSEIRRIEAQIRFEEDSMNVLKADWSLLTQPSRLQRLSEVYADQLELAPVQPWQIGALSDLPVRPLQIEDILEEGGETSAGTRPSAPPGGPTTPSVTPASPVPVPTFRASLQ
jgi:hypothetical protein